LTKKLEEKIMETAKLMMQIRQQEMDRQLAEEHTKYKLEGLGSTVGDLTKEVESLKGEVRSTNILL
jgi:hypothetical protein